MKKSFVLSLVCVLLIVSLSGCALFMTSGAKHGNPGGEGAASQPSVSIIETPAAEPARESLWGKRLSYEIRELPAAAYQKGAERGCGMAPDGVTFLMGGGVAPYLYNIETGKTIALTPASESTRTVLRDLVMMSPETPENVREKAEKLSDEELLTTVFSLAMKGRVGWLTPVWPMLQTDGNYLLAADFTTIGYAVINADTGEFYCSGDDYIGTGTPAALLEGQLLLASQPPYAAATFVNLADCRWNEVDFSSAGGFDSGSGVLKAAALLEDGSLCTVLRDSFQDFENGQDCAVVIRSKDGKDEVYPIGKLQFGKEPDSLIPVGSDYVIAFSRQCMSIMPAMLIDRRAGTVSAIYESPAGDLELIPFEKWEFLEGGTIQIPAGYATVIPLEQLSDGKTMLLQSMSSGMVSFFRPEEGKTEQPLGEDGMLPLLPVSYYNSNHFDTFYVSNITGFDSYIKLTW